MYHALVYAVYEPVGTTTKILDHQSDAIFRQLRRRMHFLECALLPPFGL